MDKFDIAVDYVIKLEGGLSNNPNDPGGITKYGISLRFLKSIDFERLKTYQIFSTEEEDIKNLKIEQAKVLYKSEFWEHSKFDTIDDQDCCNFIFDMAVNMGINPSIKCAQRACWSVMRKKEIIKDDGILGKETIDLINYCGIHLLSAMKSERAGYYRLIAEEKNMKEFLNGWLGRSYG